MSAGKVGRPRNLVHVPSIKAQLAQELISTITTRGYTQKQAARVLKTYQPRVSNLVQGRLSDFSVDMLISMLERVGIGVRVRCSGSRPKSSGSIAKRGRPMGSTNRSVKVVGTEIDGTVSDAVVEAETAVGDGVAA
jgi:predicted XRE-type DNA-binding protein